MHYEYIASIIRHVLTSTGSLIVAKGMTDQATVEAIIGGLMAVIGLVWSLIHKKAVIQDRTAFGKPLSFGLLLLLGGTLTGCHSMRYETTAQDGTKTSFIARGFFDKSALNKLAVGGKTTTTTKGMTLGSATDQVDGLEQAQGLVNGAIQAAISGAVKAVKQ